VARPQKPIDAEIVYKLAALGCTQSEIGAWFNVDEATIRYRFTEIYRQGKENGKISLRRMQWKRARAGSDPMLIHLGKHYLGQGERTVDSEEDDIIDELRRERETREQGMAEDPPEGNVQ
jgi:hypothetical protein